MRLAFYQNYYIRIKEQHITYATFDFKSNEN